MHIYWRLRNKLRKHWGDSESYTYFWEPFLFGICKIQALALNIHISINYFKGHFFNKTQVLRILSYEKSRTSKTKFFRLAAFFLTFSKHFVGIAKLIFCAALATATISMNIFVLKSCSSFQVQLFTIIFSGLTNFFVLNNF